MVEISLNGQNIVQFILLESSLSLDVKCTDSDLSDKRGVRLEKTCWFRTMLVSIPPTSSGNDLWPTIGCWWSPSHPTPHSIKLWVLEVFHGVYRRPHPPWSSVCFWVYVEGLSEWVELCFVDWGVLWGRWGGMSIDELVCEEVNLVFNPGGES